MAAIRIARKLAIPGLLIFLLCGSHMTQAGPTTLVVDSIGDGMTCAPGNCTLRWALKHAQTGDVITFNIKQGCAVTCRISPGSALPQMTQGSVTVDGTTQPKSNPNGPSIEVDGSQAGKSNGFDVESGSNTIKGLVINGFKEAGVLIGKGAAGIESGTAAGPNHVESNYIGTDSAGAKSVPNGIGVHVLKGSDGNFISSNVISGNKGSGVFIESNKNTVDQNGIGTDRARDAKVENVRGIEVTGAKNEIGPKNVVSGNSSEGILVSGKGAVDNHVFENSVGVKSNGKAALPNSLGIKLLMSTLTKVERNCVSGNDDHGILVFGSFNSVGVTLATPSIAGKHLIQGNVIGPACDESDTIPQSQQKDGVHIDASSDNELVDNVISGNGQSGIAIQDCDDNKVRGNFIGVTRSGKAMANDEDGVFIMRGTKLASRNTIGPGNHIANDKEAGVHVEVDNVGNKITQNSMEDNKDRGIKLDAAGTPPKSPGTRPVQPVSAKGGNDNVPKPKNLVVKAVMAPQTIVEGTSEPSSTVEIFIAKPDPTSQGQGKEYLGSVKADKTTGKFSFSTAKAAKGQIVTMTATDLSNNTSQFSDNLKIQ